MKKSKIATIFSLCLTPMLLLTACVAPPNYKITATSSDIQLGYVQGFDKDAMPEGNQVTLHAVSTSDSPFLCWIKDDKTIVSNKEKLTLTYNQENQGYYTALFEEKNISAMMYASLYDFEFSPQNCVKIEYELKTAILTSGSNDYYNFISSSYAVGDDYINKSPNVIYFGGAGDEYVYLLKVAFKLYDAQNAETSYEYQVETKVNKNAFDENGIFTITENVSALETNLTVKFKKLTAQDIVTDEDEENKDNGSEEGSNKDKDDGFTENF